MNRAVFLDRDNTIVATDEDLTDPEQVVLTRGAASGIASLRGLGFKIIVVTNQGGVARGVMGEEDVERVHRRINELVQKMSGSKIDRFYYCPYDPQGTVEQYAREHPWRKPQPGMIEQASRDFDIDLKQSWTIGDSRRDIAAGAAAGTRTILLQPGEGPGSAGVSAVDAWRAHQRGDDNAVSRAPTDLPEPPRRDEDITAEALPQGPDFVAQNLTEAARVIAQARRKDPDSPPPKPTLPAVTPMDQARQASAEGGRGQNPGASTGTSSSSAAETPERGIVAGNVPLPRTARSKPPAPPRPLRPSSSPAQGDDPAEVGREQAPPGSEASAESSPERDDAMPAQETGGSAQIPEAEGDQPTADDPAEPSPARGPRAGGERAATAAEPSPSETEPDGSGSGRGRARKRTKPGGKGKQKESSAVAPTDEHALDAPVDTSPVETETEAPAATVAEGANATAATAPPPSAPPSPDTTDRDESEPADEPPEVGATGPAAAEPVEDTATPPRTRGRLIPAEHTLREILQELRNQRVDHNEVSYLDMVAIVLQLVAVLCLLGALMFGQGGEDGAFMRWISVALLVQLSVIATLLFRRS